ncbi:unnamed protein product, partial [Chrysoparadoxa australica]
RLDQGVAALYAALKRMENGESDPYRLLWDSDLVTNYGVPDLCDQLPGMHSCRIVTYVAPRPFSPLFGVCVPKECGEEGLPFKLSSVFGTADMPIEVSCGFAKTELGTPAIIVLSIIALLVRL